MENEIGFMIGDSRYECALYDNGDEMLIDLKNDPGEMANVVGHVRFKRPRGILRTALLQGLDKNGIERSPGNQFAHLVPEGNILWDQRLFKNEFVVSIFAYIGQTW